MSNARIFDGQTCSVCGKPAVILVTDTEEVDPVYSAEMNVLFKKTKATGQVFLCKAHDREPACKPRFKTNKEFLDWCKEKGITLQEFRSEEEQQAWGKAQGVVGAVSSLSLQKA